MMFSLHFPTFALLVPLVSCADCWGSSGTDPNGNLEYAWMMRDAICGRDGCALFEQDRGDNHFCELSMAFPTGGAVTLQRGNTGGSYPNCYDAYENIITECLRDDSASFEPSSNPNGRWQLGDEWYWVKMNYTESPVSDGVSVGGSTSGGTMMGPAEFCQGYSPGGGNVCTDIPEGCYIDVPLYNVEPEVHCDLTED